MKKTFKLENLDCAVCAEKMKNAIAKIDGVESVDVSFMLQKLTISAPEEKMEEILKKSIKAIKKVDSDCKIIL
jgi:copper chaperone CopZ